MSATAATSESNNVPPKSEAEDGSAETHRQSNGHHADMPTSSFVPPEEQLFIPPCDNFARTPPTYFIPKTHFPGCERYNQGNSGSYPRFPKGGHFGGGRRRPSGQYVVPPKPPIPPQPAASSTMPGDPSGQHIVHLHINPGETISLHMGDHMQVLQGPATVRMISNNNTPPIPMPVQVPPGHMVQQIIDESGTLQHIILSAQPPILGPPPAASFEPCSLHVIDGWCPQTSVNSSSNMTAPLYGFPPSPLPPSFTYTSPLHLHGNYTHTCNGHPDGGTVMAGKDERTQRQYLKLRKKLESRRKDTSSSEADKSTKSEANQETTDDNQITDQTIQKLLELVSKIKVPTVDNVEPRSAQLQWQCPQLDNGLLEISDVAYEVYQAEKAKEEKRCLVYSGPNLEFHLTNLKPHTDYIVSVTAVVEDLKGDPSPNAQFTTSACEPDRPMPPKLASRNKNSLSLKWNAPSDNGSKITKYTLEQEDAEGNFNEVFSGTQKQHKITKLELATCYRFRLCAVNSLGRSKFSEVVSFYTTGSAPSIPAPPTLQQASVTSLLLAWEQRPSDDDYMLQMETLRHGFMAVYSGRETSYLCRDLNRNTEYKFRLSASNEEGSSPWSSVAAYTTLPDTPAPPGRPAAKGKVHARNFHVAWDPPSNDGGSPITCYHLEMEKGNGFEKVYDGPTPSFHCENLEPGTSHYFRVRCTSAGGTSEFSDVGCIITNAVCPGPCNPPRLVGKPKSTSLQLKWSPPEYDGGAPVTEYEVRVHAADPDHPQQVYRGSDQDCSVTSLQPGTLYHFSVRAFNRAGGGSWSEPQAIQSGAAVPDAPLAPMVACQSPHSLLVSWKEPANNGAPVTEYRLEGGPAEQSGEEQTSRLYAGPALCYEVKGLHPATHYSFAVQAVNSAGLGPLSPPAQGCTAASSPGSVSQIQLEGATASSLSLAWAPAPDHGAPISRYLLELTSPDPSTPLVLTSELPALTINDLSPRTVYKVRVQAFNSVGPGLFCPSARVSTLDLPPAAPSLSCLAASHNSLKLRWALRNPDFLTYYLYMETPRPSTASTSFPMLYQGNSCSFKVTRLQEATEYRFKVSASNEAGDGPCSPVYTFSTTKAPPSSPKAPKVAMLSETSCTLEWHSIPPIGSDPVSYHLFLSSPRHHDFVSVYRGTETSHTLTDLVPGQEYMVKLHALRHCGSDDCITGPASPATTFSTPCKDLPNSSAALATDSRGAASTPLSDQHWAFIILCCFTLVGVIMAILLHHLL